jgi:hypothetical protein
MLAVAAKEFWAAIFHFVTQKMHPCAKIRWRREQRGCESDFQRGSILEAKEFATFFRT